LTDPKGGVLFLANHPSHLDATFLTLALLKYGYQISIWTLDYVYKNPYTKLVSRNYETVKLMKVPNMHESRLAKNPSRLRKLIIKTIENLKEGQSVLFFPSGKQKHVAHEEVHGKSAVERILNLYPEVNIVFVKSTGLWGSRFSKAVKKSERSDAKGDNWIKFIWNLIKIITFNLVIFIPKRKITIEFDPAGDDFPRQGSRVEINKYMEQYFNRGYDDGEPLVRVPNYFWKADYPPIEYHVKDYQFNLNLASKVVVNDVLQVIAKKTQLDVSSIKPEMMLDRDLSLDSLEITEVLVELEKKHHIPQYLPKQVSSVGHLIALTSKIPIEYKPVHGKPSKILQEVPVPVRAWQACAVFIAGFFGFLSAQR
jgi:long-chain-fatty-acid--[acyl-carrier-protein] ligase